MGARGKKLRCSRCKKTKLTTDFFKNASARQGRGYHSYCKACTKAYDAEKYPHGKPRRRARLLEKTYGITLAQYEAMYSIQQGGCAICGVHKDRLDVDHNHATGKVRGLLCHQCNTAIGLLGEDVDALTSAIAYLITHAGQVLESERAAEHRG